MGAGSRPDDLRRRNRAAVIAALRRLGQGSRTELAAATALSPATISAIASDLLHEDVLVGAPSGEAGAARRGRPQVGLALAADAASVMAVGLSLNLLSAAVIDYRGAVAGEEHRRLATQAMSGPELVTEMVAMVGRRLRARAHDDPPLLRILVAVQGVTDSAARDMIWSPITPAENVGFADALERAFSVPVEVENDCNMMAEALRWRDPARYGDDFIAILLSDGIGMGLFHKGGLLTGTRSSGGEFGHMMHRPGGALCRCGRRGCIEAYAGNYAIWRRAGGLDPATAPEEDLTDDEMRALAAQARAGPGPARDAFTEAGAALGYGLGNIFALVDPSPVAFVGVGAQAFDLMEDPMREALALTAGGQHGTEQPVETIPDSLSLMRQGCAMHALAYLDREVFAAGERLEEA